MFIGSALEVCGGGVLAVAAFWRWRRSGGGGVPGCSVLFCVCCAFALLFNFNFFFFFVRMALENLQQFVLFLLWHLKILFYHFVICIVPLCWF
jgi:hypothetical protein